MTNNEQNEKFRNALKELRAGNQEEFPQQETLYTEEQLKQAFIFYAERPIVDIKYLDDDFRYFIESLKTKTI